MTEFLQSIPVRYRRLIYFGFILVVFVLGALHVAFTSSGILVDPTWLKVADDLSKYASVPILAIAGANAMSPAGANTTTNVLVSPETAKLLAAVQGPTAPQSGAGGDGAAPADAGPTTWAPEDATPVPDPLAVANTGPAAFAGYVPPPAPEQAPAPTEPGAQAPAEPPAAPPAPPAAPPAPPAGPPVIPTQPPAPPAS